MTEKQVDLFLDSIVNAPMKDDRALMEFPFFSLQKAPRLRPLVYDDGKVKIEVRPGDKGIATIWDKDVLIYIASIINDRIERGLPVEKTVRFNAHNLLQVTGRGSGKRAYELLLDAMFRLRSTTILTTIEAGETKERRGFGWIETFRVLERRRRNGQQVMAACEITLNDWMFRAIVKDRRVLTIDNGYFRLTMGLKRRLYELARKHCGHQERWVIALPRLIEKCGSVLEPRFFKPQLRKVVEDDDLPDYHVTMSFDPKDRPSEEDGRPAPLGDQRADPGGVLAARCHGPRPAAARSVLNSVHRSRPCPPRRHPAPSARYIVHIRPPTACGGRRRARGIRYIVHNPSTGPPGAFGTSFTKTRYIVHGPIRYIVHENSVHRSHFRPQPIEIKKRFAALTY